MKIRKNRGLWVEVLIKIFINFYVRKRNEKEISGNFHLIFLMETKLLIGEARNSYKLLFDNGKTNKKLKRGK